MTDLLLMMVTLVDCCVGLFILGMTKSSSIVKVQKHKIFDFLNEFFDRQL